MRTLLIWAGAMLVFGTFYFIIEAKEALRRDGDVILLKLAPHDPRSLMQGDYVALNYELAAKLLDRMDANPNSKRPDSGTVVLSVDGQRVGQFARDFDGKPLAPGEHLLKFRFRDGGFIFGTERYFIPEGTGDSFNQAGYGELRVAPDGTCLLIGLRDKELKPLVAVPAER